MSVTLTGLVVIGAAAAVSVAGFLVISRVVPDRWLVADSEAASALYATIGMAYAILIAIAAIAAWEPRAEADAASDTESARLVEAHRAAATLPGRDGDLIQRQLAAYTEAVVATEWRTLRIHQAESPQAVAVFSDLRDSVDQLRPRGEYQLSVVEQLRGHMTEVANARRLRLANADAGIPDPLWPILWLGGLVNIGFLYLFGLDRTLPNGLMMATVGGMIAAVLFVVHQMEFPFTRGMAIDPDAFRDALTAMTANDGDSPDR